MLDVDEEPVKDPYENVRELLTNHKILKTRSTHLYACSVCIYNMDKTDDDPIEIAEVSPGTNNLTDARPALHSAGNFENLHAMGLLFAKGFAARMQESILSIMDQRDDFKDYRLQIQNIIWDAQKLTQDKTQGDLDSRRVHYVNILLSVADWTMDDRYKPVPLPDTLALVNIMDRTVLSEPKPSWEPEFGGYYDLWPDEASKQVQILKTKPNHFRIFSGTSRDRRRSRELIFAQKPSRRDDPGLYKVTLRYFIKDEKQEVERLKEILFLQSVTIDVERHTKNLAEATALSMEEKVQLAQEIFQTDPDKNFLEHYKTNEYKALQENLENVDQDQLKNNGQTKQQTRVAYVGAFLDVDGGGEGSIDKSVPVALISVKYGGNYSSLTLEDGEAAQVKSKLHVPRKNPKNTEKVLHNCVYVDSVFSAKSMAGARSIPGPKTDGNLSLAAEMLRFVVWTSPPESNYVYFLTSKENVPMQKAGEKAGFKLVGEECTAYGKANKSPWLEYQYLYTKKISTTEQ